MHFLSIFHSQQRTSRPDSQRWFGKTGLGVLAAVVLCPGGTSGAEAQDAKTFPGSTCQASGSSQNLYYSSSLLANRTASTQSAVCPIVRDNVTQPWQRLAVRVRDRHDTQNVTCMAYSRDLDGTTVWSQGQSAAGEGFQTLTFNIPTESDWGTYTLVCQLPPMQDVNQPSYIATYLIQEP
jgi:hypothetical protein